MLKSLFSFRQVKRTSHWNKACEELRKHQELLAKVKQNEAEFLKDPYGDPFNSEDIKAQLKGKWKKNAERTVARAAKTMSFHIRWRFLRLRQWLLRLRCGRSNSHATEQPRLWSSPQLFASGGGCGNGSKSSVSPYDSVDPLAAFNAAAQADNEVLWKYGDEQRRKKGKKEDQKGNYMTNQLLKPCDEGSSCFSTWKYQLSNGHWSHAKLSSVNT